MTSHLNASNLEWATDAPNVRVSRQLQAEINRSNPPTLKLTVSSKPSRSAGARRVKARSKAVSFLIAKEARSRAAERKSTVKICRRLRWIDPTEIQVTFVIKINKTWWRRNWRDNTWRLRLAENDHRVLKAGRNRTVFRVQLIDGGSVVVLAHVVVGVVNAGSSRPTAAHLGCVISGLFCNRQFVGTSTLVARHRRNCSRVINRSGWLP